MANPMRLAEPPLVSVPTKPRQPTASDSQRTTVRSMVTPAGEERHAVMFWFRIEPKRSPSAAIGSPDCHYPPGASKWNPIEHRLFSQIIRNWAGRPLESYETVVKYNRSTTTSTGLEVSARLLRKRYEKGEAISDQEMRQVVLTNHKTLPGWNYTLTPSTV